MRGGACSSKRRKPLAHHCKDFSRIPCVLYTWTCIFPIDSNEKSPCISEMTVYYMRDFMVYYIKRLKENCLWQGSLNDLPHCTTSGPMHFVGIITSQVQNGMTCVLLETCPQAQTTNIHKILDQTSPNHCSRNGSKNNY